MNGLSEKPQGEKAEKNQVQVIARAASILRALEGEDGGLSLGEIARRVSLARSTVQRIVASLESEKLLKMGAIPKSTLDKKQLELVAERYVDLLADHGVSDKVLQSVTGIDETLDSAIEYYLDVEDEDDDDYKELDF